MSRSTISAFQLFDLFPDEEGGCSHLYNSHKIDHPENY